MGLALRNPSEPDRLLPGSQSVPPNLLAAEHRYQQGRSRRRAGGTQSASQNPHAKYHRRPLSWWSTWNHGPLQGLLSDDFPHCNRDVINTVGRANHRLHSESSRYGLDRRSRRTPGRTRLPRGTYRRQTHAESLTAGGGGQSLVRSGLVVPYESYYCSRGNSSTSSAFSQHIRGRSSRNGSRSGSRSRNHTASPPSLDRQDAFRDPLTTKKRTRYYSRITTSTTAATAAVANTEEEAEIAELYRLGLLYDDEHERGSGFTLDTISHHQPIYTINHARPMKHGRKSGRSTQFTKIEELIQRGLPLDLSCAALSEDAELATYLVAASERMEVDDADEMVVEEAIGLSKRKRTEQTFPVGSSGYQKTVREEQKEPPAVRYELEGHDDFSQEDTDMDRADEQEFMDSMVDVDGFNNNNNNNNNNEGSNIGEEEGEESWAFINNDFEIGEKDITTTDRISMAQREEDTWIHIEHLLQHNAAEQIPPRMDARRSIWLSWNHEDAQEGMI